MKLIIRFKSDLEMFLNTYHCNVYLPFQPICSDNIIFQYINIYLNDVTKMLREKQHFCYLYHNLLKNA